MKLPTYLDFYHPIHENDQFPATPWVPPHNTPKSTCHYMNESVLLLTD